jgi:hypothetical protein
VEECDVLQFAVPHSLSRLRTGSFRALAVSSDTCIHYPIICLYRMFKSVFQSCLHSSVPAIVLPIYFLSLNHFSSSLPSVTQASSPDRITIFITLSHSFSLPAPCPAAGKQNAALPCIAVYQSYVSIAVQHLAKFHISLFSRISKFLLADNVSTLVV